MAQRVVRRVGGFRVASTATRFTGAWTSFALAQKAWAYAQDELPSTHPVVAAIPDLEAVAQNFDGITYAKGAAVLKALVGYVGEADFLSGLTGTSRSTRGAPRPCGPARGARGGERPRPRGLGTGLAEEAGVTTLRAPSSSMRTAATRAVVVEQLAASRPEGVAQVLRPHRVALGVYRWTHRRGRPGRRHPAEAACGTCGSRWMLPGAASDVPALVGVPAADLLLVNDDDLTYAKVRLDAPSLATALRGVGALDARTAAGPRVGCALGARARWGAARPAVHRRRPDRHRRRGAVGHHRHRPRTARPGPHAIGRPRAPRGGVATGLRGDGRHAGGSRARVRPAAGSCPRPLRLGCGPAAAGADRRAPRGACRDRRGSSWRATCDGPR